jgi:hypothetical protein
MSKGIVVDHKESGVRYAISETNFNKKVHTKVRDLRPGETVIGFRPLRKSTLDGQGSPASVPDSPGSSKDDLQDSQQDKRGDVPATKTEGSSPEGTKDAK